MTTCSETLEENALVAVANHDALIQKLGIYQDDLTDLTSKIKSTYESQSQKLELIDTKMAKCSVTLEENALVAVTNQDALIQKLDKYQDDSAIKMETNHNTLTSKIKSMHESQSQKLELIDTKMTTCSEILEVNELVAIANHDVLIQKLDTNQDDLTSKMNSMQDLVQSQGQNLDDLKKTITSQEDLTGRLDSLEALVEDQRDLITKQSEMLATISTMISNQNFLLDCFVNCSLTIDNYIKSVSYNGLELAVTGPLTSYQKENSFNFKACDRYKPGVLTIKGHDTNSENNCVYGGLLLHCIANDISNPWHNFVTDQTHWKVSDGSTPCTDDNGWIVRRTDTYIKKMKDAGAIQIWSNAQTVTLIGTPDAH